MKSYSNILLICDPFLRESAAMERARALAAASACHLHLAILDELPIGMGGIDSTLQTRAREETRKRQERWLASKSESMKAWGIKTSFQVTWTDDPLPKILEIVESQYTDLLIKDTQFDKSLHRTFITPLDWKILRHCKAPTHLVSSTDHPLPQKVVAALDLSKRTPEIDALNDRILESAKQLALHSNAELHILQAYDLSKSFLVYAAGPVSLTPEIQDEISGRSREGMARIAEKYGIPEQHQHIIKGPTTRVIANFASDHEIDVVVMGTLYRHGIEKIIGSTTEQTLYKVKSSILAIRP